MLPLYYPSNGCSSSVYSSADNNNILLLSDVSLILIRNIKLLWMTQPLNRLIDSSTLLGWNSLNLLKFVPCSPLFYFVLIGMRK